MKYQRLTIEELENLKDDFIRFLASQGIDAELWQKMKAEDKQGAEDIIDVYSDLVYDQALGNCKYLEHISAKEFKSIYFDDTKANVIGLRVKPDSPINLNTDDFISDVQKGLENNQIEVFSAVKDHEKEREPEMYEWIKKGAYMANEKWYVELHKLV